MDALLNVITLQYVLPCTIRLNLRSKIDKRTYTRRQRRQWQPTPVFLPGESHGRRSLVGCSPWGREESDTAERLISSSSIPEELKQKGLEMPPSKQECVSKSPLWHCAWK